MNASPSREPGAPRHSDELEIKFSTPPLTDAEANLYKAPVSRNSRAIGEPKGQRRPKKRKPTEEFEISCARTSRKKHSTPPYGCAKLFLQPVCGTNPAFQPPQCQTQRENPQPLIIKTNDGQQLIPSTLGKRFGTGATKGQIDNKHGDEIYQRTAQSE
ncbi:hypothetical protein TRVL_08450 [Trypanosoma vivax]|nr:hypothetical protein TRVL_08450 [Trypanosoma vivax]